MTTSLSDPVVLSDASPDTACECSGSCCDGSCDRSAAWMVVVLHVHDDEQRDSLVIALCDECLKGLQDRALGALKACGPLKCATCGAMIVVVADLVPTVAPLSG